MFTWTEDDLNSKQTDAINHPGSVFLVACPGSGKTRTLTYKIALELSRLESPKQFVVAITYTHRAADEIHERIETLGVDTSRLWIGTIHAFCLEWILKPYGIYHPELRHGFRVINGHDTEALQSELCKPYRALRLSPYDCGFYFNTGGYILTSASAMKRGAVEYVVQQYFQQLSANRQIDFELMLFYSYQLLRDNPAIAKILSNLFRFMLVDEYQDTKQIQYAIIALILKAGEGKIDAFVVGDPNQAIFQTLGGYPIKMQEFMDMAGITMTPKELSDNYRSSTRIVDYFGNFNVYQTTIEAASDERDYASLISYNNTVNRDGLLAELVRLIRYNIETVGIPPHEVCVLAPQWVHLGAMTRMLVSSLPEYKFQGPGLVPFSRDIDNFWYKLSRIVLTRASPTMFTRRMRWAGEVLTDLESCGIHMASRSRKSFLRECNSIQVSHEDGLAYLTEFFQKLCGRLGINIETIPFLKEHHTAFFTSATTRIQRLQREGATFIGSIASFRNVFEVRRGVSVSTIHGIKGDEYDAVIAYALLQDFVPHFNDPNPDETANKLLYVISSRARKNLHLISERGRTNAFREEYVPTRRLEGCVFDYDIVP
jgi:DNA helicase-2/ATP-dependent DNA helicase PcrA